MKWISILNKLPDEYEMVLVFGEHGIDLGALIRHEFTVVPEWQDTHLYEIDNVTHWMVLPKEPQSKE